MDTLVAEVRLGSLVRVRAGALADALSFYEYQRLNDLLAAAGLALHVVNRVPKFDIGVKSENSHSTTAGEIAHLSGQKVDESRAFQGEGRDVLTFG